MQNQPSSICITNGYDPQAQTYLIPGNPPYRVPAIRAFRAALRWQASTAEMRARGIY
jgi:hypothetical protein